MKALYLIILVIVAAAALYLLFSKTYKNGNHDGLPEAYAEYQSIDSVKTIESGTAQLQLLFESEENIQSFLTEANNVIICTVHGKSENTFYKIAPGGDVIDSLRISRRTGDLAFVKGFIIDKEMSEYYKWSFNGNKAPIRIPAENAGFDWDTGRQKSKLADIKSLAGPVYVDYRFKTPSPEKTSGGKIQTTQASTVYAVLTYFTGDDCFQFYTTLDISRQFPWSYTQQLIWNNLFKRIDERSAHNGEIIPSSALRYRYFHRGKKEKVRFSGGGGNAPGFTKELYPGYLVSDVVFKEDTIKIKEFMYLDEEWPSSAIEIDGKRVGTFSRNRAQPVENIDGYMYYTNHQLQYSLFANSDKKIFQIRKKKLSTGE
ncbi:hypothetical protein [Chitinophaga sp. 22620]|uniref:hypothetical protein n=1 Tax=Chitinophaga sp. 22620 TaxID=3453952 RepID=UPI003F83512B